MFQYAPSRTALMVWRRGRPEPCWTVPRRERRRPSWAVPVPLPGRVHLRAPRRRPPASSQSRWTGNLPSGCSHGHFQVGVASGSSRRAAGARPGRAERRSRAASSFQRHMKACGVHEPGADPVARSSWPAPGPSLLVLHVVAPVDLEPLSCPGPVGGRRRACARRRPAAPWRRRAPSTVPSRRAPRGRSVSHPASPPCTRGTAPARIRGRRTSRTRSSRDRRREAASPPAPRFPRGRFQGPTGRAAPGGGR